MPSALRRAHSRIARKLCRPREGGDFRCPVYYKKTKGWVNAYYLLTSDGVRLGGRFSQPSGWCQLFVKKT
jgi:hypothetical protein